MSQCHTMLRKQSKAPSTLCDIYREKKIKVVNYSWLFMLADGDNILNKEKQTLNLHKLTHISIDRCNSRGNDVCYTTGLPQPRRVASRRFTNKVPCAILYWSNL